MDVKTFSAFERAKYEVKITLIKLVSMMPSLKEDGERNKSLLILGKVLTCFLKASLGTFFLKSGKVEPLQKYF